MSLTAALAGNHPTGSQPGPTLGAPSQRHPLTEFFRYHGAWAPGIRLFRAIGFRAKAIVISTVFALPITVLATSYFSDKAASIEFSAKERVGVAYLRETMPVLQAMQRQRLWSLLEAAKGAPAPELAEATAAVATSLQKLAVVEASLGGRLGTAKAYATLLDKSKALPTNSAGVAKVLMTHNEKVDALLALIATATDNSNLTLDPDLDTYYLMDGAMGALPMLIEATARLRGMATALSSGAPATAEYMKAIHTQEVVGDLTDERWAASLDKIATQHPDIRKAVNADEVRAALHKFHEVAAGSDAPAKIAAAGSAAVDGLFSAQTKMADRLDALLAARVSHLERSRNLTALLLLLSLGTVVYLFMSFRKVLEGGLKEVAFHIDAMRDGDLTTTPRAWGADEAASLMLTLVEMQDSLRRIVHQVRGASDNIVHSSSEIAAGSMDLSSRTEQAAANLEESASAMEEISATVKHTAEAAQEAAALARKNATVAERGGTIIGTMVSTMDDIQNSSRKIGDIIGTIDGIAFQTNILALNAAVEAARAGDAGRGFAVVAAEVRQLAQRSAAAAREIKGLITASVDKVESGTSVVKEAGSTIEEIVVQARRVNELLADIATGAREQASGVQQTTQAVHEMDTTTQQNAALVEQTAAAAASLKDQARALASEVAQFKLP
jgi:methyl-accepting chemotaxis protein